jgi:hypothetical protein
MAITALGPALAAALAPAPAAAQSGGGGPSVDAVLALFGLSVGTLLAAVVALLLLQVVAILVGARAAGLPGSIGRPVLVLLATALISLPLGLLVAMLDLARNETVMALFSSVGYLGAATTAIKWVYGAPWARALLAFFIAGTIANLGAAALLFLVL